jgi:hypothetical protein
MTTGSVIVVSAPMALTFFDVRQVVAARRRPGEHGIIHADPAMSHVVA